jgi:phosphatidylglycerophosphate synthase
MANFVTLLGLGTGALGLYLGEGLGFFLLGLSIVLDCLDGWLARATQSVSTIGAELDWHSDILLSYCAAWRFFSVSTAIVMSIVLGACQMVTQLGERQTRVSGRTLVIGLAFLHWVTG